MKNENIAAHSTQMYITAQASCFPKSMFFFLSTVWSYLGIHLGQTWGQLSSHGSVNKAKGGMRYSKWILQLQIERKAFNKRRRYCKLVIVESTRWIFWGYVFPVPSPPQTLLFLTVSIVLLSGTWFLLSKGRHSDGLLNGMVRNSLSIVHHPFPYKDPREKRHSLRIWPSKYSSGEEGL